MTIAANNSKPSIGKTGVHLCYHKHHEYKKLTHEQRHELSEWRQDYPDAHKPTHVKKPSHVKKPWVTKGPVKSKQISMLVSQQVAAEMKKYNPSGYIGSTNTEGKASADNEKHLMAMVQSAVSKHFATPPNQPNPIRRPTIVQPAPNWRYTSNGEPEANEQSHDNSTCNDVDDCFDPITDLDGDGVQARVDEFFSHSTNASRPRGVTPEHLSKIWHISQEDAKRTINTTT